MLLFVFSHHLHVRRPRPALTALLAGLIAMAAACVQPTADRWEYSRVYVRATLHDSAQAPVAGATMRFLVARGICPDSTLDTVSEFQSDETGVVASMLQSAPVGTFSGCIRLHVVAPPGFRDTTTTGVDAVFRSPTTDVVDTVNIDLVLRHM